MGSHHQQVGSYASAFIQQTSSVQRFPADFGKYVAFGRYSMKREILHQFFGHIGWRTVTFSRQDDNLVGAGDEAHGGGQGP